MTRRRWAFLIAGSTIALGAMALPGTAQFTAATSQPDDAGPMRGGMRDDGGGPGGMRGGWDRDHGGPGGPGGMRGGGGPGGMERRMPSMDVMRGYMELVDRYTRLSSDPDAAGISAVLAANDLMKAKGAEEAIAYFAAKLDEAPRPAIKRAIRLQLIDLYRATNKTDLALAQMEILMKAGTAEQSTATPAPADRGPH